jgi:hypothetical protein
MTSYNKHEKLSGKHDLISWGPETDQGIISMEEIPRNLKPKGKLMNLKKHRERDGSSF